MFAKVMTLFVLAASVLWAVASLFIDSVAGLEFAPGRTLIEGHFLPGLVVVPVILLAYLFNGIYVNLQAGVYIEEKTKYFPLVTGVGALVNVAVNLLLIPRLGIMGAALAVLASYIAMAFSLFLVTRRIYPVAYEFGKLAKILATVIATGLFYYYLYYRVGLQLWHKFALLGVFAALLFGLRVITRDDLRRARSLLPAAK
jgi:O-antigen/teichoic acid export membrane protein